jgi:hypothetical protein
MTDQHPTVAPSAGATATKRWLPLEQDFEAFVNRVIEKTEMLAPRDEQQTLFGDYDAACPKREHWRDIRGLVSQAFLSMFEGLPEDHVVIHPDVNREFVSRCRLLGTDAPDSVLNRTLLNVRKASWHTGIERNQPEALGREAMDQIGYGAEIAARLVQIQCEQAGDYIPSIDGMMCEPDLRCAFDRFVSTIAPGHTAYRYRLAAFAFRKSGRASTVRLGKSEMPEWQLHAPLRSVDPDDVPDVPGLYAIVSGKSSIFVGSTLDLRSRVLSHLSVDEGRTIVPADLLEPPRKQLELFMARQPAEWKPRRAEAVAFRMKSQQRGRLNFWCQAC